jgi:hypothetical protein
MKHLKLFNSFVNEDLNEESLNEAKQEHIKYLQDFITRWDDAQEKDQDLKSLEAEYNKKLTQFGLPKMSADELLHQLQGKTKLSKVNEGVVSIKGGRILAHKVLNKLVDMEIIPVKKKTEDLVETVASVLASASLNEGFEVHYSDGVRQMKKFGSESQAVAFAKDLIKNKKGLQHVDVFNAGSGFHSTADTDALVAWWGDGSFMDNKSKNDPKIAAKKIDEAMVQVAGKNKPSGAQVLATVIIDHMIENSYLKPGADKVKKELVSDLQKLIMDSTF